MARDVNNPCNGVSDGCKLTREQCDARNEETMKSDAEKLALAKRVLLQHLNNEDYEMSLAGLLAELTQDD